jgi:exodeoxyribonuclease VII small subunit
LTFAGALGIVDRGTHVPRNPPPERADDAESELSFEQILQNLEAVVASLEQGDAPLEQALSTFERGVALARQGARRLDEAERRIEVLLSNGDEDTARTRPLDKKDLASDE